MVLQKPSPIKPENLLRLPRELRDIIYYEVLQSTIPIPIQGSPGTPPIHWMHPILNSEALEAFYKVNHFILDIESSPQVNLSAAWGPFPECKQYIRHLIVLCNEHSSTVSDAYEYEKFRWWSHDRSRWSQFLEVPHLQSLTINMQKAFNANLLTFDFGPILYHLRTLRPKLSLSFNVSFDTMLHIAWDDPWWEDIHRHPLTLPANRGVIGDEYVPMGYIDVSDLIAPPSDEDREYVEEHMKDRKMRRVRMVEQGLLGETVANRRVLGKHYVVTEPALLRVLMEEHYEIYLKSEANRKGEEVVV